MFAFEDANVADVTMPGSRRRHSLTHDAQLPSVVLQKQQKIETISLNWLIQFEIRLKLVQNQQQKRFKPIKLVKKIKECWNPTNFAKNGDTGTIQISDLPGFWTIATSGC